MQHGQVQILGKDLFLEELTVLERSAGHKEQVKLDEDGSFEIYASHQNPGMDNWISTQGYPAGHILIRTLLANPPMEAEFSVVKLDSLL